VTFSGGIADRVNLDLANVPLKLRVVADAFGNIDALDADGDEPKEGETVHFYERKGLGWMHFKEAGDAGNAFTITADYFHQQPTI